MNSNDILIKWLVAFSFSIFAVFPWPLSASDEHQGAGKLTIVTSFPRALTDVFRREFERENPDIQVEIYKDKTGACVKYLRETKTNNTSDIFWVSAPDAMEILKSNQLLQTYTAKSQGIPATVSGYPLNDPEGYYSGFAAAGYGVMWNERLVSVKELDEPTEWEVLATAPYFAEVGMSAPSRSGTTHLTIETILQGYGWEKGWALLKQIGGNAKVITARSDDVPLGVEQGEFAAGVVIDFYGLGSRARRNPVAFAYPKTTTIVPANVAIVANAPNRVAAAKFIEFLLSDSGQTLLLEPEIRRLPVRPEVYDRAADDFPNPYKDKDLAVKLAFDVMLSKDRYRLIDSLFDAMITFHHEELKEVTGLYHNVVALNETRNNSAALRLIEQARKLIDETPVREFQSRDGHYVSQFVTKRKKSTDPLVGAQKRIEDEWDKQITKNYAEAKMKLEAAADLLK